MFDIDTLLTRFGRFRAHAYDSATGNMPELAANGQAPSCMIIGCVDSRVAPELLFDAEPGEVLCQRHATAMVPPYRPERSNDPETSEFAVHFAVEQLGVRHIIVMFHRCCGGIAGLMASGADAFVNDWRDKAYTELVSEGIVVPDDRQLAERVERHGLIDSYRNLCAYPPVDEAVQAGALNVHGWYFDIVNGNLETYCAEEARFQRL